MQRKRLNCHRCWRSRRGQWQLSKLSLLSSLLPAPSHSPPSHISFTLFSLSLSFFISYSPLSSYFFYLSFFLHPCSLICLFPLSGVCTIYINYSEAVSQFLQLIQSEWGSALMGSCCTCYRLQHTLETLGWGEEEWEGRREGRNREGKKNKRERAVETVEEEQRMRGSDKDSKPTKTNRRRD